MMVMQFLKTLLKNVNRSNFSIENVMQKKKKNLRLVPSNIVTKMAKKQRSSFVKIGLIIVV